MFFVYQILSGESWNGQTSIKDFKKVVLVKIAESFEQISDYADRKDIFIESRD